MSNAELWNVIVLIYVVIAVFVQIFIWGIYHRLKHLKRIAQTSQETAHLLKERR